MRRELFGATTVGLVFVMVVVVGSLAACAGGARMTGRADLEDAIAARLPTRGVLLVTSGNDIIVFDADEGRAVHSGEHRQLPVSRVRDLWALAVATRSESVPKSSHAADFDRRLLIADGDDIFEAKFDGPRLPPSSAAGLVAELHAAVGLP
jgi:hypothetical protein